MAAVAELMERLLRDVFNETDPERRAAAIAEIFTEDVVFTDTDGTVTGRAAGGTPVVGGLDVAVVRHGQIATLYTVLNGAEDQA